MNSQTNTSTIAECKDTSEKIDLYESCVIYKTNLNKFFKVFN